MQNKLDMENTYDLPKILINSIDWIVIRIDEKGMHAHMSKETSLSLITFFLYENPDIYKNVVHAVNATKKHYKK
jgi:hypothetical protein